VPKLWNDFRRVDCSQDWGIPAPSAPTGEMKLTMMSAIDSVLLIGFGGPTGPSEVMPFLENVVRGRNIPRERLEEVAHHYEEIGGRSPYNDLAFQQAAALKARLEECGVPVPVYVGMRNWHPFLVDVIREMSVQGSRRAAGIILATHRTGASHDRYQLDVRRAVQQNGEGPEFDYVAPWFDDPLFHEANASRIEEKTGYRRGEWPAGVPLLFTAHSIPCSMAESSPYLADLRLSCAGAAAILNCSDWELAYQSRSGDLRTPWLEPDISEVLERRASEGVREVVVQPVGFLQDHVEVLYDLDVEARETADRLGLRYHRSGTVCDHPAFIELLAERVLTIAQRPAAARAEGAVSG
jgi:protoporphyrin/coproporphyrin ferrochelatase